MMSWPSWAEIAYREELHGVEEVAGDEHNPRIIEYLATVSVGFTSDETAWCSAFVNWNMRQAFIKGTNLANARSWLTWGQSCDPRPGAVIVLWRERVDSWKGHVGFFGGIIDNGARVLVRGGNQGNQVSTQPYPVSRILDYRWPTDSDYYQIGGTA
jgi:uncharacterized protein (TIGR02594 family)